MRKLIPLLAAGLLWVPTINTDAGVQTAILTTSRATGESVTLQLTSLSPVTVDWGDGNAQTYTGSEVTGTVKGTTITITGDEYWTGLDCSGADLTALQLTNAPELISLNCSGNNLASLSLGAQKKLKDLDCSGNRLSALQLSSNTEIEALNCSDNSIRMLTLTKLTSLRSFDCSNNQISSLGLSSNTALTDLWCSNNNLTRLVLNRDTLLKSLVCSNNDITEINVSGVKTIVDLWADNNNLTSLDLSGTTGLQTLSCDSNQLSKVTFGSVTTSRPVYYLSYRANNLSLSSFLVPNTVTNYFYQPQDTIRLDFNQVNMGEFVSLTSYVENAYGTKVGVVTLYDGTTGKALKGGLATSNDYFFNKSTGKLKVHKAFSKVYATITAAAYPDITFVTSAFASVDPTGIRNITDNDETTGDGIIYNLKGQRVENPAPGIYIKNHKKIIIK